ncbi:MULTISPECIES: tyrosine--tRNA ligase [unclassified Imperialibacter]|uniref:tyrosine--tRNA ligase n=1 Tax=unclassified Imperialibacter TaxID=2629706 RepID=UPI001257CD75|nr:MULTISPECIES: tyrosine--tRNA ligase [unclassified Imperialibacter]CAD5258336.1 Tyrosine--tRNA ligase [Imperialibacter sp. 75]CAD5261443.1 Tyrosine--tRNA ligase [Imperialibacter sp. 89]VVT24768.1 Tyrosine--tRNA ligase [Imperialibacter sp. EC-SDR9]
MIDFIEELKWRGMLNDMMPGTEDQLKKEMTSAYIGFDPTAASLHIGNLATIMLLVHLQRAGHKPYALVGGATGMIGDPSGKSEERNLLDEDTLRKNQEGIKVQLEKFLAFDSGKNAAVMVNNYDWFKKFGFLEFLRDAGKHITVNYMMAKDSVRNRLETGLSFTEFSYQLLQGYDFYHLYTEHQVKLQMGGSDQWGNITTGTEFIRRKASGEAYALTTPLVTKADGTKFGKSEGGNVWLDPEMTSPYKFYQFWLNCSDDDSHRLIRVFTLLGKEEIEKLEKEHAEAPHLRIMQQAIAKDVTTRVHSEADYNMAVKASSILFGKDVTAELEEIDEKTLLQVFEGVPMVEITRTTLDSAATITDLLSTETNSEIFTSKGEARKMIQQGGVSINKLKATDANEKPAYKLLQGKYLLCQKGKKNYYLIKVGS